MRTEGADMLLELGLFISSAARQLTQQVVSQTAKALSKLLVEPGSEDLTLVRVSSNATSLCP